ncbi:MAG: PqqD family peptide modification chaperone [Deltaproteobacteria bacterium]
MHERRTPRLMRHVRLRKREPVAYDGKKRTIYELNDVAAAMLRLADGKNDVDVIAEAVESDAETVRAFMDDCAAAEFVEWLDGDAATYRVPELEKGFRLRRNEPIGYSGQQSAIFKLNPTAYEILQQVDGERDEMQIAIRCTSEEQGGAYLATCRRFLERCASEGMVRWKTA